MGGFAVKGKDKMASRTPEQRTRDEQTVEQALLGKLLPPHDRLIHAKVVGVTHTNADGSSRQDAIGQMRQFELVELKHNPNDEWDRNAIQVFALVTSPARRRKGDSEDLPAEVRRVQIGHLEADLAAELAPALDRSEPWHALVTRVMLLRTHGVSLLLYREAAAPAPLVPPADYVAAVAKAHSMPVMTDAVGRASLPLPEWRGSTPRLDVGTAKALRQYLRRLVRGRASRFRVDAVVARAMRGGL
jgi:hypothetical protein